MIRDRHQGRALFAKLYRAAEQFLDVTLSYMGAISYDELVHKSVKKQQGILSAYPNSLASREIKRIADKVMMWPQKKGELAGQQFFLENYFGQSCATS